MKEKEVMKSKKSNFDIYYKLSQKDTYESINESLNEVTDFIERTWKLKIPKNIRIYVMDNWIKFIFQSAPVYYWPMISLSLIFTFSSINKNWNSVGGWAKKYGSRYVIGVKDKNLISLEGSEFGKKIFIKEKTIEDKLKHIVSHEIMHACLADYKIPHWFNEGMAMITVDKILNKKTVRDDTLNLLKTYNQNILKKNILSNYIVGYWFVKYIDDKEPEILKRLLGKRNVYDDTFIKDLQISFVDYRDNVIKYFET